MKKGYMQATDSFYAYSVAKNKWIVCCWSQDLWDWIEFPPVPFRDALQAIRDEKEYQQNLLRSKENRDGRKNNHEKT